MAWALSINPLWSFCLATSLCLGRYLPWGGGGRGWIHVDLVAQRQVPGSTLGRASREDSTLGNSDEDNEEVPCTKGHKSHFSKKTPKNMQKKNFVFPAQVPPHLFAISDLAYRSMLSSKYFLTYTFSTFLGTCELFHSKEFFNLYIFYIFRNLRTVSQ